MEISPSSLPIIPSRGNFLGRTKRFANIKYVGSIPDHLKKILTQTGIFPYHNRIFSFRINYQVDIVEVPNDNRQFISIGTTGVFHNPILICTENQAVYCLHNELEFVNSTYLQFLQTMAYIEICEIQMDETLLVMFGDNSEIEKIKVATSMLESLQTLKQDLNIIDKKALDDNNFWSIALAEYQTIYPVFDVLGTNNPFKMAPYFSNNENAFTTSNETQIDVQYQPSINEQAIDDLPF